MSLQNLISFTASRIVGLFSGFAGKAVHKAKATG